MALDVLMELCGAVRARVSRVELSGVKARGLMGAGAVKLSASSMSKGVSLGVRCGVQRSAHTHKSSTSTSTSASARTPGSGQKAVASKELVASKEQGSHV